MDGIPGDLRGTIRSLFQILCLRSVIKVTIGTIASDLILDTHKVENVGFRECDI